MTDGNFRRAFPYRLILSILMGVVLLYLAGEFCRAGWCESRATGQASPH